MATRPVAMSVSGYALAVRQVVPFAVGLFTLAVLVAAARRGNFALDFDNAFWPAGSRVLHGESPYVAPGSPDVLRDVAFVYPALAAVLLAPFAALPSGVAAAVFTALCIGALILALRAAGVRDPMIFALVFFSPPVIVGYQVANVSMLLALGLAGLWRWRDRPLVAGVVLALLVSVKLFLWPLALWLVATRRYVAFGYALLSGVLLNAAAWTVLGWGEVPRYLDLVHALAKHQEGRGYSPIALLTAHGVPAALAYGLGLGVAAVVAWGCWALGRQGRDVPALALCVAASLLATPVLWPHYFVLLMVPLALARRGLSAVWAVPLAMWVCPPTDPLLWQAVVGLTVGAVMVTTAGRCSPRDHDAAPVAAVAARAAGRP